MAHVREIPRSNGKTAYEVRWREGTKFRQKTFTVKRDAERFAVKQQDSLDQGIESASPQSLKMTVDEVVKAVLAAEQHRLKPRTYDSYAKLYAARIHNEFGHRPIRSLRRTEVQAWINRLTTEGLSPGTVRHHYIALQKLCKWATRERIIETDPCAHVGLPKPRPKTDYPILTPAQINAVAAQLANIPPYGLLVRFAAHTGLRLGELAGLRVGDVRLAERRVFVRQTAQRIKDKGWVFGTPKSDRSTREVPLLDSDLIDDLDSYLKRHPKREDPEALIWPGRAPGSREPDYDRVLDGSTFLRNHFDPAVKRAGLPKMRVHDLRHTAASIWLAAGVFPYEVSRWLGHASVTTTDAIYTHLYPSNYGEHKAKFEAYKNSVSSGNTKL